MRKGIIILFASVLIAGSFFAFLWNTPARHQHLIIAVSKASGSANYERYISWLEEFEPNAKYVDLSSLSFDSAMSILEYCHALLLTGGPDVYPAYYNMEEDTVLCGAFDFRRDSLEMAAIELALNLRMPVLGICRGLQILNVAYGGSLYADIPQQYDNPVIHRLEDYGAATHSITTVEGSRFGKMTSESGSVNSIHHQAIRKLAPGFRAVAHTSDGIIEAIESEDEETEIFAVQWHPERMDIQSPFSANIAARFLNNAMKYKVRKNKRKVFR